MTITAAQPKIAGRETREGPYSKEDVFIEGSLMRWIIAALLPLLPANLSAQPTETRGYVFGGLLLPWQEGVTTDDDRTYLAAPGGWSTGVLFGGGARINRRLSIEGEFQRTGIMETLEPSRYFITYSARRRDTRLAVGARIHLNAGPNITLEPMGMFEFVREESWLAQRTESPGLPPFGDLAQHSPFVNSWGSGLAGGMDVRLGGRTMAVLPGVRIHRIWRGEEAISTWPGGRSSWGLEILAAGRLDF